MINENNNGNPNDISAIVAYYDKIRNCKTLEELTSFLMVKPYIIPKYANTIITAINSMPRVEHYRIDVKFGESILRYATSNTGADNDAVVNVIVAYANYVTHCTTVYKPLSKEEQVIYALCLIMGDLSRYDIHKKNFNDNTSNNQSFTEIEVAIASLGCDSCSTVILDYTEYADKFNIIFGICDKLYPTIQEKITAAKTYIGTGTHPFVDSIFKEYLENTGEDPDQYGMYCGKSIIWDIQRMYLTMYYMHNQSDAFVRSELLYKADSILHRLLVTNHLNRLGSRYFGNDIDVIISEIATLTINQPEPEDLVKDLIKFANLLAGIHNVKPEIAKLFIFEAFTALNSRLSPYNHYDRIVPLINKEKSNTHLDTVDTDNVTDAPHADLLYYSYVDTDKFSEICDNMQAEFEVDAASALESVTKLPKSKNFHRTVKIDKAQHKIYNSYKNYKDEEAKIDAQLTETAKAMGRLAVGNPRDEIIEGKKFSVIGTLKKILGASMVFGAFGKFKGALLLFTRFVVKKKLTAREKLAIIAELDAEIDIIDEKIEDAKAAGDDKARFAKYQMMRSRNELKKAKTRIQVGMSNDRHSANLAKDAVANARGEV